MARWLPLESNPEVMNKYIYKLGVSNEWALTDVLGLESEMLEWLPKPVKAIILLFPCSEAYEKHRLEEEQQLRENPANYPDDLFYMKQIIHNACGTIALVHSIANNKDIQLNDDGVLKKYIDKALALTPSERGKILEEDCDFTETHHELAQEGQTVADADENVNHHFISLIHKDGSLYELDGRKSNPIRHGETTEETFLEDAAKVCKDFIARDPNEVRFTIIALTAVQN